MVWGVGQDRTREMYALAAGDGGGSVAMGAARGLPAHACQCPCDGGGGESGGGGRGRSGERQGMILTLDATMVTQRIPR